MSTTTAPTDDDGAMDEVDDLRRELDRLKKYVRSDDPELYKEILEWCDRARSENVQGIRTLVKRTLSSLQRDHKMRDHVGVDDAAEAFPDQCEGCEHYEVACPVVKSWLVRTELEGILDEDDEVRIREDVYDLASRQGCHVLQEEIEEWEEEWSGFVQRGYRLRNAVIARIEDYDESELPTPDDIGSDGVEDASPGGSGRHTPPPEARARIESVTQGAREEMASDGGDD